MADPRFVIQRSECVTFCEEQHPVRLGRSPQHHQDEPWNRKMAINEGKKGYLCPGGEQHLYPVWTVYDEANESAPNVDTFDTYREAVAERDRQNRLAIREIAVRAVDARHGYTCEFSGSPEAHIAEYEVEEHRLLRRARLDPGVLR